MAQRGGGEGGEAGEGGIDGSKAGASFEKLIGFDRPANKQTWITRPASMFIPSGFTPAQVLEGDRTGKAV